MSECPCRACRLGPMWQVNPAVGIAICLGHGAKCREVARPIVQNCKLEPRRCRNLKLKFKNGGLHVSVSDIGRRWYREYRAQME